MSNEPNPRSALRAAIEANAKALSSLHHAEIMLKKANDLHGSLTAKRAEQFDSLDAEIKTARAANIKAALANDGDANLLTKPIEGHAAKLLARGNLDEQISGVSDSLPTLQQELEDARQAAIMTDYRLDEARAAVFADVAERLASEFLQRLDELRHTSLTLGFMSVRSVKRNPNTVNMNGQYWGQGDRRTIEMPPNVLNAINEEILGSFDRKNPPQVKKALADAVQDWWAKLRIDPDATLSESTKDNMFRSSVQSDASLSAAE